MRRIALILAVLILTLPPVWSADQNSGAIWRVSNGVLTVAASTRDAGAVCNMIYDGKELVNDHDHGRQLQVAWTYNGLDEAYNPTEAGGEWDGAGPHSSSKLLRAETWGNILRTVSHPAYWRNLSIKEAWRKNTALVTNDILSKTLTLGYGGDPHVLVFDSAVQISPELTGPPITALRIEAPTLYASPDLSRHYRFEIARDRLEPALPRDQVKDQMNTVINFLIPHDRIPILATPDGRRAVAFYAPAREGFRGYVTWNVPSDDPTNACGKVSVFFGHPAAAGRTYAYRTFIIVGDQATVRTSVRRLRDQQAHLSINCEILPQRMEPGRYSNLL